MRFGIEFVPNVRYYELEYYSKLAEDNGFGYVWITDHYNNRNVYAMLTLIALKTQNMRIGAGVANPYHTHPAIIASAIATVNEISGGRAVLGIAAGDRVTLERIGVKWEKPLSKIKEAVEVIKALHTGKPVNYDGDFFRMQGARLDFKAGRIPIYVGAQGPKMLKLAAEIGDGVLINASHPKDFEVARQNIEEGLKDKNKDFDVVAYASLSVDKNGEKAKDAAKIVVAFIVAGSPDIVFERHGISQEDVMRVKTALNNAFTKGDWKSVHEAVTEEMVDIFSISGTPDEVIERIEELSKVGVTQVVAGSPLGPNKAKAIKIMGREIIPGFPDG
ncbi:5,10-methylenetetrahydromethanopterin reductase [Archaeoglobus veneficus]|uniref:5,10-methylenetetrahydromethanopterin reductase n=1 Tax=Archaeoglobus veneficus (strain DSM 11195 / SNP6) TaxID=693661 RepID=F2KRY3_ARCVS|nr:5,10-methylenetetrahydromethanopterin reductase [Archaeoglobus veneficus]AEA46824.1 5,10-methylenetetrahydromethanopterin reductase [Archaeoglobus veneficus SNP6]